MYSNSMRKLVILAAMAIFASLANATPAAGDVCKHRNERAMSANGEWLVCISAEPVWSLVTEPDKILGTCQRENMIGQAANGDILVCHDGKFQKAPERKAVAQYDKLPATGNTQGDVRTALSTGRKVVWVSETWVLVSKPGKIAGHPYNGPYQRRDSEVPPYMGPNLDMGSEPIGKIRSDAAATSSNQESAHK